jgi:histidinol-phosphate/aromatic aminotransferase/cobyric acid decarboxylase-like protein
MEAISRASRYPARDADPLRKAISAANPGITAANVVVGNGSSEVLVDLLQILDRPGEVVFPWASFPFYSSATRVVGLTENARWR